MSYELKSNFKHFIEGLIVEKRTLSLRYIATEKILRRFDAFCADEYPEETTLTQEMALNWALLRPGESVGNLDSRTIAMRQLAKYIRRRGHEAYILPEGFTGKRDKYTPHIYNKSELSALFHVMDHVEPRYQGFFYPYIVPVIYRLIYTCGLRPIEALILNAADVNLQTGEILIREAKGNRDRIVVLSFDMLELCKKYYVKMRVHFPHTEVFFPNCRGEAYSRVWLAKIFTKMWTKTGIKTIGTQPKLYNLRHTFATECLFRFINEGKDLNVWLHYLSAYMGHKDYDSTAYYMHLVAGYFPVERKGSDVFNEIIPEVRYEVY